MKIKDLKTILNRYDDNSNIAVRIGIGTAYRINKGQITSVKHDDTLIPVLYSTRDTMSAVDTLVFELEYWEECEKISKNIL